MKRYILLLSVCVFSCVEIKSRQTIKFIPESERHESFELKTGYQARWSKEEDLITLSVSQDISCVERRIQRGDEIVTTEKYPESNSMFGAAATATISAALLSLTAAMLIAETPKDPLDAKDRRISTINAGVWGLVFSPGIPAVITTPFRTIDNTEYNQDVERISDAGKVCKAIPASEQEVSISFFSNTWSGVLSSSGEIQLSRAEWLWMALQSGQTLYLRVDGEPGSFYIFPAEGPSAVIVR